MATRLKARSIKLVGIGVSVLAMLIGQAPTSAAYIRPGEMELVSTNALGGASLAGVGEPGGSSESSISDDGRYVAFESSSVDLVVPDDNGASDIFLKDRKTGSLKLISTDPAGLPATGECVSVNPAAWVEVGSFSPSISSNGRYVSFGSCATNLVVGDTNLAMDVFVYDSRTGVIKRVSVSSKGGQSANADASLYPGSYVSHRAISADGRVIAFSSTADNLVEGDTNGVEDQFVHDLETGWTERVSVSSQLEEQDLGTWGPHYARTRETYNGISSDGRYVAFYSNATNLVPGDNNATQDVFVHDRKLGKTELVSLDRDGRPAGAGNGNPAVAISADGRFVIFFSVANTFVPKDSGGSDMFVFDRKKNETKRVSVSWTGAEGKSPYGLPFTYANADGFDVDISDDGRFVTFDARGHGFAPEDTRVALPGSNLGVTAYVHDMLTGATESVSGIFDDSSKPSSMSRSGRYITFWSNGKLTSQDTNGLWDVYFRDRGSELGVGAFTDKSQSSSGHNRLNEAGYLSTVDGVGDHGAIGEGSDLTEATIAHRPLTSDLFFRLEVARLPLAQPGLLYGARFDVAGTRYEVRSASAHRDASFGLYRCGEGPFCSKVSDLMGGFGTTGEEVAISLPLIDIGSPEIEAITDIEAFTALGTLPTGAVRNLDTLKLN